MSIEEHEFSDSVSELKCACANDVAISMKMVETPWVFFNRQDVIAMAKHLKLTEEDLK